MAQAWTMLKHTDSGAPNLTKAEGSLNNVLYWALVENLGWSATYIPDPNIVTVFRANEGNDRCALYVEHSAVFDNTLVFAKVQGCNTGSSPADVGGFFPATAPETSRWKIRQQVAGNSPYYIFGNGKFFYFFINYNNTGAGVDVWNCHFFGELLTKDNTSNVTAIMNSHYNAIDNDDTSPIGYTDLLYNGGRIMSHNCWNATQDGTFLSPYFGNISPQIFNIGTINNLSLHFDITKGQKIPRISPICADTGSTTLNGTFNGANAFNYFFSKVKGTIFKAYLPNFWLGMGNDFGGISSEDTFKDIEYNADAQFMFFPIGTQSVIIEITDTYSV